MIRMRTTESNATSGQPCPLALRPSRSGSFGALEDRKESCGREKLTSYPFDELEDTESKEEDVLHYAADGVMIATP